MIKTGLIYDEGMKKHEIRDGKHPEQPNRISHIYNKLKSNDRTNKCTEIKIRPATEDELLTTHKKEHLDEMKKISESDDKTLDILENKYNSIYFNKHSYDSALLSCGGVIELAERVIKGEINNGVAI